MMTPRTGLAAALAVAVLATTVAAEAGMRGGGRRDRVARDFRNADQDGDDYLGRAEWNRRGNFDRLDRDGDGRLSLREVRRMYKGHDRRDYDWPAAELVTPATGLDPTAAADRVDKDALADETRCGIARLRRCGVDAQIRLGFLATGTGPVFSAGAVCPGIDDYWAMDYSKKRNAQVYHGGIDIPVPWGTPMLAVAAGTVIAKYEADRSKRGTEVVLRHSPAQTGLPVWTYSAYGHLDAMPDLQIGQRVAMGQIIGPTGNSGISGRGGGQSTTRRPAIHLATFQADGPTYGEVNNTIVPVNGRWLDPFAFYRGEPPFDSEAVKALPEAQKGVPVAVILTDGTVRPAGAKRIWPYACERQ
jgi:murein DD-endopeptidase MepM/ murein hydrolase activator NlpD